MTKAFLSLIVGIMLSQTVSAAVPTLALTFDTNVITSNMTSSQEAKIQSAEEKIKAVISSDAFRTRVLNHSYRGVKRFVDNNGLTNSQIYYKILYAAERLNPTKNNTMDMGVKTYYQNSNVVGFTSSGSTYINMNTKFLNKYSATNVTRNMMHEWLHKIGFSHAVSYSTSRDYSVPYGVGQIMEDLAANY